MELLFCQKPEQTRACADRQGGPLNFVSDFPGPEAGSSELRRAVDLKPHFETRLSIISRLFQILIYLILCKNTMTLISNAKSMIIGTGLTQPRSKTGLTATTLMLTSLERALANAGVGLRDLDGLIAVPSLAEPRFMEAHYLATRMNLLPHKNFIAKTIDTGGAGPITGLLEADRMIRMQGRNVVAVIAGDAVSSLDTEEFLRRADAGCSSSHKGEDISPVIPLGYDRVAQWQIRNQGVTREQLAMVSVLMSRQALRHPLAMTKKPLTLEDVLNSKQVGPATNVLECARRADGGAALIVANADYLRSKVSKRGASVRLESRVQNSPLVLAGGEASGPLYPPPIIDEEMFSCDEAASTALRNAGLQTHDIDFFGLYDCFPICFLRAVEAVKLAPRFGAGKWIEEMYQRSEANGGVLSPSEFPVNTHGGLLSFGAPWETPAMYNIIEAVAQLTNNAHDRQVPNAKKALVYGNGGIFSASAVAILGKGETEQH
jgi:acetyl-CoA acetyltransferase